MCWERQEPRAQRAGLAGQELAATPSQTVGPYFSIGLTWGDGRFAVEDGTPGRIWIRGRVTDGNGEPVPDAVV